MFYPVKRHQSTISRKSEDAEDFRCWLCPSSSAGGHRRPLGQVGLPAQLGEVDELSGADLANRARAEFFSGGLFFLGGGQCVFLV